MAIERVKRKKGYAYVARVYLGTRNGKRKEIVETFKTEKEAKVFEAKSYNYKNNNPSAEVSDKVIFSVVAQKYFADLEKKKIKINTVRNYKSKYYHWIDERLGYFSIGKINHLTLSRFIEQIQEEGIGESSLFIVHVVLKNIFKYATESIERYIIENPMMFIRHEKPEWIVVTKDKYYDEEEIKKFLNAAKDSPYYYAILFALNAGGPRFGELASIRESDLDFESRAYIVKEKLVKFTGRDHELGSTYTFEPPKSNKVEPVPLNDMAIYAAKEAIKASKGHLFIFSPGNTEPKKIVVKKAGKTKVVEEKFMSRETFAYAIESIAKKAGIRAKGTHVLRHTYAAQFLLNGGDIYRLSRILRHASVEVTIKSYGHLTKDFMSKAINFASFGDKK